MIHPELANVSKTEIKAKLAQTLKSKEENISIFGLKTKFGGGRSTGFALIYDSLDARKKYDSKKMLRRVSPTTLSLVATQPSPRDQGPAQEALQSLITTYYIGRLPCQIQVWPQAEKGNQGQSQEGQRYCQG